MRPPRWYRKLARRLNLQRERVPAGPRRRRWPEAEDLPRSRNTRLARRRNPPPDGGHRPRAGDDPDDGGSAVREPRRPVGPGPRSDAGANPIPEPPQLIALPLDPERR